MEESYCRIGGDHLAGHVLVRGSHASYYCTRHLLDELACMAAHDAATYVVLMWSAPSAIQARAEELQASEG